MNETEIGEKLEDLQVKVNSILRYQEFEQLMKTSDLYMLKNKIVIQEMKNMELETKLYYVIKNLQSKVMLFVGVPLVMMVFSIIALVMKIKGCY